MTAVAELTGAQLDFWTGCAEGFAPWFTAISPGAKPQCAIGVRHDNGDVTARFYRPSTDWAQGGPLIEKHIIGFDICFGGVGAYARHRKQPCDGDQSYGETPLIAICRAVVRAAFGDEVQEITP